MSTRDEYQYTTADLADEFQVHRKTIQKRAFALGLGVDFGGRAGRRYTTESVVSARADAAHRVAAPRRTHPCPPSS